MNGLPSPREQVLDFIRENMSLVAMQADAAYFHASADDLVGLAYATRRMLAHARAASSEVKSLLAENNAAAGSEVG